MVLYLALSCAAAQACGPDFHPDTFVRTNRPDLPRQFVQGQLGLLQPGFAPADLLVAYRYLDGGTLDSSEQKGWAPTLSIAEQVYGSRSPEPVIAEVSSTTPETSLARWMDVRKDTPTLHQIK
jgi:hypothetical protein